MLQDDKNILEDDILEHPPHKFRKSILQDDIPDKEYMIQNVLQNDTNVLQDDKNTKL